MTQSRAEPSPTQPPRLATEIAEGAAGLPGRRPAISSGRGSRRRPVAWNDTCPSSPPHLSDALREPPYTRHPFPGPTLITNGPSPRPLRRGSTFSTRGRARCTAPTPSGSRTSPTTSPPVHAQHLVGAHHATPAATVAEPTPYPPRPCPLPTDAPDCRAGPLDPDLSTPDLPMPVPPSGIWRRRPNQRAGDCLLPRDHLRRAHRTDLRRGRRVTGSAHPKAHRTVLILLGQTVTLPTSTRTIGTSTARCLEPSLRPMFSLGSLIDHASQYSLPTRQAPCGDPLAGIAKRISATPDPPTTEPTDAPIRRD